MKKSNAFTLTQELLRSLRGSFQELNPVQVNSFERAISNIGEFGDWYEMMKTELERLEAEKESA